MGRVVNCRENKWVRLEKNLTHMNMANKTKGNLIVFTL